MERWESVVMLTDDVLIYCACMEKVLLRINLVRSVFKRTITTGADPLDTEIVFLQFRRILEGIAFASLAANKAAYAAVRDRFATDWHAKRMLEELEHINENFYPQPLILATIRQEKDHRRLHFEPVKDGFLTKQDFVKLYDYCGNILHEQNPYGGITSIHVGHSPKQWLSRIEKLLRLHRAQLAIDACWIGAVPDKDGKVHTYLAEARGE